MKRSTMGHGAKPAAGSVRRFLVLLAGGGILLGAGLYLAGISIGRRPPNIILISIDTLRHDHLGYTGHLPRGRSPSEFIDGLAREGTVFTRAESTTTWTLPGHYALLTGLPNELHAMVDDRVPFDPGSLTLPRYLKQQGYETYGFFSGPYLHPFFGFDRGFDKYVSCMKEATLYDVMKEKGAQLTAEERKREALLKEIDSHREITSESVTSKALYFAKTHDRDRPLFLFLHYFDVHNDYIPPEGFRYFTDPSYHGWVTGEWVVRDPRIKPGMAPEDLDQLRALYDGEIAWVDHNIRRFFEGLRKEAPEILDDCLVVITSDHGEEFFEHGRIGHRGNLYAPTLRIPLLFWSPGRVPAGKRIERWCRIYDVVPTVLDLAGLPLPESVYGRSLAPLMRGEPLPPAPSVAELTYLPSTAKETKRFDKFFAFRAGDYKLIVHQARTWSPDRPIDFTGTILEEKAELFDLAGDPEEKKDLAGERPDLMKRLLTGYREELRRMARYAKGRAGTAVELPEALLQKIRDVGYAK